MDFFKTGILAIMLHGILLGLAAPGYGQGGSSTGPPDLLPKVPTTPTTAALERYAQMPVSEHTGTPSISVPLFSITSRQLSLPLSLSYHASGVRVTDDASWVGLSWSLNAGGMIARALRGEPDEKNNGFLEYRSTVPDAENISDRDDQALLQQVASGVRDFQPDLFSYNTPAGAGQFMFGNDGQPHFLPFAPLRLIPNFTGTHSNFELTLASGDTYQFATTESTQTSLRGPQSPAYISAWYLTRILSADRTDTITFEYVPVTINYFPTFQQQQQLRVVTGSTNRIATSTLLGVVPTRTQVVTQAKKLRRIRFAGGYVDFLTDTAVPRLDLPNDAPLRAIVLYATVPGHAPVEQRRFELTHSYFQSSPLSADSNMNHRLRLDAVTERAGGVSKPPHTFGYAPQPLPPRDSFAQDHWGYFNGVHSNLDLIPRREYPSYSQLGQTHTVGRAERRVDVGFAQAGILTKIRYPTGGTTTFEYESNTINERYALPRPLISKSIAVEGAGSKQVKDSLSFVMTGPTTSGAVLWINIGNFGSGGYPKNSGFGALKEWSGSVRTRIYKYNISNVSGSKRFDIALTQGRGYELTAAADNENITAGVRLEWEDTSIPLSYAYRNVVTGGLRIHRITSTPQVGSPPLIQRYEYGSLTYPDRSSGYGIGMVDPALMNAQYQYQKELREGQPCSSCGGCFFEIIGYTINVASSPLGQFSGQAQPVAYSTVSVFDGTTNGKTVNTYLAHPDEGGNRLPFLPVISHAWRRSQLQERRVYASQDAATFTLREHHRYRYVDDSRDSVSIVGFKVVQAADNMGCYSTSDASYYTGLFSYDNTVQTSIWQHLDSTITTRYPISGAGVPWVSRTAHRFDNPRHAQLTQTTTVTGPSEALVTRYRYPLDYALGNMPRGTAALGLQELQQQGVLAALIEQQQWRQRGSTPLALVSGTFTEYQGLRPHRILEVQTAAPVSASVFQSPVVANGELVWDARYREQVVVDAYDAKGNVAQQHRSGELPTVYLWGYQGTKLVTQIRNATLADVQQRVQSLGLDPAALDTDAQVRAAGTALRYQLPTARVTSYTHAPLVGMTSQTDPTGRTMTYEYDALGRLLRTRDEQGRILTQQEYHYARP